MAMSASLSQSSRPLPRQPLAFHSGFSVRLEYEKSNHMMSTLPNQVSSSLTCPCRYSR